MEVRGCLREEKLVGRGESVGLYGFLWTLALGQPEVGESRSFLQGQRARA